MTGSMTIRPGKANALPAILLLLAFALLGAVAPSSLAEEFDAADVDLATLQRVARVLDRLGDEPTSEEKDQAVRDLTKIGPDAAPCLLALGRRYGERIHIDTTVRAMESLGSSSLDTYLIWMAGNTESMASRREAYLALGRQGTAAALPALLATMEQDPVELKDKSGAALAGILRRHPGPAGYGALSAAMGTLTPDTRIRVLDAVAEVGSVDGFRLHAEMLGKEPALEGAIVSGLARMQHADDTASILPRLRRLVEQGDAFTRRQAVIALGKYEDPASIGILIDLLGAPDKGIRENALWSLRNVSACKFPADPQRWRVWHAQEMAWWEAEGQAFLDTLRTGTGQAVLVAIRRLTERPLFRNVAYAELARLAREGKAKIGEAAAAALARLGFESNQPPTGILAAASTAIREMPEATAAEAEPKPAAPPVTIGLSRLPLPLLFGGGLVILYLLLRVIGFGAVLAQKKADRGPISMQTRSLKEKLAEREGVKER